MKTKQKYERPQMQVVKLRQEAPLVCTSGDATLSVEYYEEDL